MCVGQQALERLVIWKQCRLQAAPMLHFWRSPHARTIGGPYGASCGGMACGCGGCAMYGTGMGAGMGAGIGAAASTAVGAGGIAGCGWNVLVCE